MYQDYYLRFSSEEEMLQVFNPEEPPVGMFFDVIGKIYGIIDGESIPKEGWHVNVRAVSGLPSALTPYEITKPTTPYRVWA